MKRVLIAYKYIPQYRLIFFTQLRDKLAEANIMLTLVYGDPTPIEAFKKDAVYPAWGKYLQSRVVSLGTRLNLIYQPFFRMSQDCDLVIVEQANRLLINLFLIISHRLGYCQLAYWGHGLNFQRTEGRVASTVKRILAKYVRWWFAYNDSSAMVVKSLGFPAHRITRVMNTIDNVTLTEYLASVSAVEMDEIRHDLGLEDSHVCLYVGGMYDLKRLEFLMHASEVIHERLPTFRMLFIGSGEDSHKVAAFAESRDWVLYLGAQFSREKALYLKLAHLMLMPGLVGLAVIDSFVAEVPIVTTDVTFHSPEIEYLHSGVNGMIVSPADSVVTYADYVVWLLQDKEMLAHLRNGCRSAAQMYSMEKMVKRFATGISEALADDITS